MQASTESDRLRLATVVLAAAFLAGSVGYVIGTTNERVPSETDLGFTQDMITHHEQAVVMARRALEISDTPTIRSFAIEVVIFQMREIGRLDGFLERWGKTRKTYDEPVMDWMGMPMPLIEMPGYADPVEIESLEAATGPEFDALFLRMLAVHHAGGTQMAGYAAQNARDDDLAALASVIARNQTLEITEYGSTSVRLGLPDVPGAPTYAELAEIARLART